MTIQPGEFMMGCSSGDDKCTDSEKPAHRVRITKRFDLGRYEVMQAQWESVMGSNPSDFKTADRPVEHVNRDDVREFLQKLNAHGEGYRYRLPTKAEWKYAARAGNTELENLPALKSLKTTATSVLLQSKTHSRISRGQGFYPKITPLTVSMGPNREKWRVL